MILSNRAVITRLNRLSIKFDNIVHLMNMIFIVQLLFPYQIYLKGTTGSFVGAVQV